MVLVQNKYKNTLVGVLRTQITFVMHSSPSCYVTLRTQVIRLNSGVLLLFHITLQAFEKLHFSSFFLFIRYFSTFIIIQSGIIYFHCIDGIPFFDILKIIYIRVFFHIIISLEKWVILISYKIIFIFHPQNFFKSLKDTVSIINVQYVYICSNQQEKYHSHISTTFEI